MAPSRIPGQPTASDPPRREIESVPARPALPKGDLTGATLGDFTIDRLLGRGGMGEVYLARQKSLGRQVALKVLRPDLVSNPTLIARFKTEARAAARINHPNIVHIYAFDSAGDVRFIAMEYVPGTNLRDYLEKHGKLPSSVAMAIMLQTARAVGAAGERGLVHRDIKPENILLTKNQLIKVADFGLCRDQSDQSNLTRPGTTMGTPLYMSPEQCQGKPLDHRSDLYSLGVTYFHMLAGEPPFRADSPLALALKHISEPPPDLSIARPDLPPGMAATVMKLLAKSPADRHQNAAELLEDLDLIQKGGVTTQLHAATFGMTIATLAVVSAKPESVRSTAVSGLVADKPAAKHRFALRLPAACVAALALGALTAWFSRVEDLLGPNAPVVDEPPGLWIDPEWKSIPKQHSAEAQYRRAQLESSADQREAAWLAVPGRFREAWVKLDGKYTEEHRNQHKWSLLAYLQVVRDLWRAGDRDRLSAFADELTRSNRSEDQRLGAVAKAAVASMAHQFDESLDHLTDALPKTDPAEPTLNPREPRPRIQQSLASAAKIDLPLYELIAEILRDAAADPEFFRENEAAIDELLKEVCRRLDVPQTMLKRPA